TGARHAALLAKRANRRRVTRSVVRGGLQLALAVARHRPPGACAHIFCSCMAALLVRRLARSLVRAPRDRLRRKGGTAPRSTTREHARARSNFAGETIWKARLSRKRSN